VSIYLAQKDSTKILEHAYRAMPRVYLALKNSYAKNALKTLALMAAVTVSEILATLRQALDEIRIPNHLHPFHRWRVLVQFSLILMKR